jgi:hypothetical protein
MEKRALIALAISFIIFVGFGYVQQHFLPPPAPVAKPGEQQPAAAKATPSPTPAAPALPTPALAAGNQQPKDIIVDTPLYQAVFTEQGARVKSFRLKKFWDQLPFKKIADFTLWMFSIDIQKYRPLGEITDPKELVRSSNPEMLPLGLTWKAAAGAIGPNERRSPPQLHLCPAGRRHFGENLYL